MTLFFIYDYKGRRRAIPLCSGSVWELTPYVSTLDSTRCINQPLNTSEVEGDLIVGVRVDSITVHLYRGWITNSLDDVWRRDHVEDRTSRQPAADASTQES